MKPIVSILLIILLSFVAGLYFPWWAFSIAAFAVGAAIPQRPFKSFLTGFTGVLVLWAVIALVQNTANGGVLAERVAKVFSLGGGASVLIFITSFLGGLIGGFSSMAGSFLRKSN